MALINTTTPSIGEDIDFAEALKQRYPACRAVLFGTHVTAFHEEIMQHSPFVDGIIRHEPEWTARDLAAALAHGVSSGGVPGCTLRINGRIAVGADRPYDPDLDALGWPAWEHFPLDTYVHPVLGKPYLMVNTSRGCGHACIFCVASLFYGKKVRYRSVESIVHELEQHVIGRFGVRHVWMYADDFTRSPQFVKELCRAMIERRLRVTWWTNTRADCLDEEMYRLMRKAGCCMLSIGGESGNAEMLKRMGKGTRPEHIRDTVRLLRRARINSLVYFLIGLPGETRETIEETVRFATQISPDYVEFYPATPYPGTRFYDMAVSAGLIATRDWERYMCGGREFVVTIPGMTEDELDATLLRAYRRFYLRPAYVWRLARRAMHPVEFWHLMSFGLGYARRFFGAH